MPTRVIRGQLQGKMDAVLFPEDTSESSFPYPPSPRRNKEYCLGVGYTYQAWRSSKQKPSLSRTVLLFAKMKQAALVRFASWDLGEKSLISAPIQFGISPHQMKFKKCLLPACRSKTERKPGEMTARLLKIFCVVVTPRQSKEVCSFVCLAKMKLFLCCCFSVPLLQL